MRRAPADPARRRPRGDPAARRGGAAQRLPDDAGARVSAAAASGARAPARSTPRSSCSPTRACIRSEARDGGNVFELTDAGSAHVEEHRERLGSPWQQAGEGVPEGVRELGGLLGQVGVAVRQVMHAGTEAQVAAAAEAPRPRRGARSTACSPTTSTADDLRRARRRRARRRATRRRAGAGDLRPPYSTRCRADPGSRRCSGVARPAAAGAPAPRLRAALGRAPRRGARRADGRRRGRLAGLRDPPLAARPRPDRARRVRRRCRCSRFRPGSSPTASRGGCSFAGRDRDRRSLVALAAARRQPQRRDAALALPRARGRRPASPTRSATPPGARAAGDGRAVRPDRERDGAALDRLPGRDDRRAGDRRPAVRRSRPELVYGVAAVLLASASSASC